MSGISGRQWAPPIAIIIGMDNTYIIPDMLLDSGTPTAPLVTDPITSRPPLVSSNGQSLALEHAERITRGADSVVKIFRKT